MLKPKSESSSELAHMDPAQQKQYAAAVADEMSVKQENIIASTDVAKKLKDERKEFALPVAQFQECRQFKGVSLNDVEAKTGISKSSLFRLDLFDSFVKRMMNLDLD